MRYVALAPLGNLLLPLGSRRAAATGLSLWSATRRRARLLQRAYKAVAATAGAGALPGERVEWQPSLDPAVYALHNAEWRSWFGEFSEMAVYRPTQADRSGFAALLLRSGRAVGFVKCRPGWDAREERRWLNAVTDAETFMAPRVFGLAEHEGWTSLGYEPLPYGIHSPAVDVSVMDICREISDLLAEVVFTDPARPKPMHGDLGPWNLRILRNRPVLFDWETVRAGPEHADFVFHQAAIGALGLGSPADLSHFSEARRYWIEEISRRVACDDRDARLASGILDQLRVP